jgi:TonB family protein
MTGKRRRVRVSRALTPLVILCLYLHAPAAWSQTPSSPSDGSSLQGWKVEHTRAEVIDGVLRVGKGNGWVRTERVYADFVLSFAVRVPADRSVTIFLRAWPTFDRSRTPTNAYGLKITGRKDLQTADGWQRLEVECIGGTLTVRADGAVVYTAKAVGNPQGHLALSAPEEPVEFRGIEVRSLPRAQPVLRAGVFRVGATAASSPTLRTRTQPRYTAAAMRARITGTVTMQAVVLPDGTVSEVAILQSLDPHFGLDSEAMETVKRWTFSPGKIDGQAVVVGILIELDFNLR